MRSQFSAFHLRTPLCLTALALVATAGVAPSAEAIYINEQAAASLGFTNIWDKDDVYRGVVAINLDGGKFCTGTLIDSRTIVTAAHCVEGAGPDGTSRFFISFGTDRNVATPHDGTVSGAHLHHDRTGAFAAYDIALLSLDQPVTGIAPIVLAGGDSDLPTFGETMEIAGYGRVGLPGAQQAPDDRRRFAVMNFGGLNTVETPHPLILAEFRDPKSPSDPDFFRLGADGIPVPFLQGSAAPGDSGGPVFIRRNGELVQIGTVVGGAYLGGGSGDASIPDYGIINFFTPVALFGEWLQENMAYRAVTARSGEWKWSDAEAWTDRLGRAGAPANQAGSFVDHGSLGRYYSVNLTNPGHVTLDISPTIDDLTIADAGASLAINVDFTLDVIGASRLFAGVLQVDGALRSSSLSLFGGVLSGFGGIETQFGLVNQRGIVMPGSAAAGGTLAVTGAYVQGAQGLLWSRLGAQIGHLSITGTAELDGGLLLSRSGGAVDLDRRYGVLNAGGGVSGTFARVDTDFAFLEPHLDYAANGVSVRLHRNEVPFSSVAATGNQRSVVESLATLGSGPIIDGILSATKQEARTAFSQLSGEAYASTLSAQIGQAIILPNILFGRMAAASGTVGVAGGTVGGASERYASMDETAEVGASASGAFGLRSWAMLYGSRGQIDRDANAGRATSSAGGIFTGLEYVNENSAQLGVAFGYGTSNVAFATTGGRASSEDFRLAAYGAATIGDLTLSGGAALGWHDNKMERPVALPGFNVTDRSTHRSRNWQIFGEAAYGFRWDATSLSPYVNFTHTASSNGAFQTGGGAAALTFNRSTNSQTFMTLGLRGGTTLYDENGIVVRGKADIGWRRALQDLSPVQTARFNGSSPFQVRGSAIDRNVFGSSIGLSLGVDERMEFDLTYSGQFGKRSQDHGVSGRLSLRF